MFEKIQKLPMPTVRTNNRGPALIRFGIAVSNPAFILNGRAANLEANPEKFLPAPAVPEEKISYELPGAVIEEPAPVKRKQISTLLPQ